MSDCTPRAELPVPLTVFAPFTLAYTVSVSSSTLQVPEPTCCFSREQRSQENSPSLTREGSYVNECLSLRPSSLLAQGHLRLPPPHPNTHYSPLAALLKFHKGAPKEGQVGDILHSEPGREIPPHRLGLPGPQLRRTTPALQTLCRHSLPHPSNFCSSTVTALPRHFLRSLNFLFHHHSPNHSPSAGHPSCICLRNLLFPPVPPAPKPAFSAPAPLII